MTDETQPIAADTLTAEAAAKATTKHIGHGVRAAVKAQMAECKEGQEEQRVQKPQDLEQMAELEKQAEDWSRLNRRLNMRLPVMPPLSRHERDEMEQQVREIDPYWNTGSPGGVQRRRNEAYRIREYFKLDRQPDGEVDIRTPNLEKLSNEN